MGVFNPEAKCSKCGGDNIGTAWCPGTTKRFERIVYNCNLDYEHIHRWCSRCKYKWNEETIENQE